MDGFSSLPMKNCDYVSDGAKVMGWTHVIEVISCVSTKCEQFILPERSGIARNALKCSHKNGGSDEAYPSFVQKSEGLRSKAEDVPNGQTQDEEKRRECWANVNIRNSKGEKDYR